VKIDGSGRLIVYTRYGKIIHPKAQAWQLDASGNFTSLGWQPSYNLVATNEVKFTSLGSYNTAYPLVIAMDWGDQQALNIQNLEWSTYYGGTAADLFYDSKTDANSNLYVTGVAGNNTFPTINAYQPNFGGASADVAAGKFSPTGVANWVTFFGSGGNEYGFGIAVDPSGRSYVTGVTSSSLFPTVQYTASATSVFHSTPASSFDIYIFRLDGNGICDWSTYYGGSGVDQANAIECDASGNVFLTGYSESSDFPTGGPGGAFVHSHSGAAGSPDAIIVKFNGTTLDDDWSTYFGGSGGTTEQGNDIAIDPSGNVVITGQTTSTAFFPTLNPGGSAYVISTITGANDAFIGRFSNNGAQQWTTYYGGSNSECGNGVGVNSSGDIYVTGRTSSTNFSCLNLTGAYNQSTIGNTVGQDAFILKFSGTDFSRQWATYYGGTGWDEGMDLNIDQFDNLYITGYAGNGFVFPTNPASTYTQSYGGGTNGDAFCGAFYHSTLAYTWGSYLGGTSDDVANTVTVDANGKLFLLGSTLSDAAALFPLDNDNGVPYYQGVFGGNFFKDGFITRLALSQVLSVNEIADGSIGLALYPNPASEQIFVNYNGQKGEDLTFTMYNMLGEVVQTVHVGKTDGTASYTFDLSGIASGVYFIQVQCNGQTTSKKFIKQ
jgi:hypothetical protein